ncbi:uncharacterized protein LOC143284906 [Babylonia areolata]|uniref:uncharacterized protein LOC143284906 n=1 Tax=Babylonia areolata TaxID=304850 RepID=UPI003FD1C67D
MSQSLHDELFKELYDQLSWKLSEELSRTLYNQDLTMEMGRLKEDLEKFKAEQKEIVYELRRKDSLLKEDLEKFKAEQREIVQELGKKETLLKEGLEKFKAEQRGVVQELGKKETLLKEGLEKFKAEQRGMVQELGRKGLLKQDLEKFKVEQKEIVQELWKKVGDLSEELTALDDGQQQQQQQQSAPAPASQDKNTGSGKPGILKSLFNRTQSTSADVSRKLEALQKEQSKQGERMDSMKTNVDKKMLDMETEHATLQDQVSALEQSFSEEQQRLKDLKAVTEQEEASLRKLLAEEQKRLEKLEEEIEVSSHAVSFHAKLRTKVTMRTRTSSSSSEPNEPGGQPRQALVLEDVVSNHGGGYDPSTGLFTCPQAGTYCFMATSSPNHPDDPRAMAALDLVVEGKVRGGLCAYGHHWATGHCVVRLREGQQVWLRIHPGEQRYAARWWTTFTGMLLKTGPAFSFVGGGGERRGDGVVCSPNGL